MILDLIKLVENFNLNIKGVIHIGAHYGQENEVYNELNIKNRIFFEPLKNNFNKLKENIGDEFLLINKALGNENKKVEMYVDTENQGGSSSILKPKIHLIQYPHIVFESIEEVEMTRLDDIEFDINNYNFINIDVQGYELEVFKGSSLSLDKIDYIMCEVNRGEIYENCAMIEDIDKFLSTYGFKMVEVDWAGGGWGDAFYIKEKNIL
jgi:FkbM family methyltransferase